MALVGAAALFLFASDTSTRSLKAEALGLTTISDISPRYGPTAGGTYSGGPNGVVTITGSGFSDATAVLFGSDASTDFTVLSDSKIVAVPPAHAGEGVPVSVSVPWSFFTTLCSLPLPCDNAYYYMTETNLNVSIPVGVVYPHTTETLGPISLSAELDELDAPLTMTGRLRLSQNLGIPTALDVDVHTVIPNLQMTLSLEGQGKIIDKVIPYWILVPNFAIAGVHIEADVSAAVQVQPTLKGLTGHVRFTFANGSFSGQSAAQCNGQAVSLTNIGDCAFVTPSISGEVSLKVDPFWFQVGEKNILGTGANARVALSALRAGLAGGFDSSLPGGLWGDACWSLLYWEWEFKLPNVLGGWDYAAGQEGNVFGPWNVGVLPAGNLGAADNCPLGRVIGWSGNGPTSGGWGSGTPSGAAIVTDIPIPDSYTCSQPGFLDFEGLGDTTNLSALSISGMQFKTTGGWTWIVADTSTGHYNAKYPNGAYTAKGTNEIWLGVMQGAGRIDFTAGPASYFSVLTSNYSQVYLDAYDAGNHLLATAGPAGDNTNTGHMAELKITRATPDIAYVMIHDAGNYWVADAICTNAPGVPGTISHLVDNTHHMQTGDHASGNFLVDLVAGVKHYLHILVGPFFSDVDLVLTRPDGTIVAPGDPGVIYDKGSNSIEVGIEDAQAGEWHYEIIANQLEPGGEDIHITVDDELVAVANEPPTLTIPGDQAVQYSDLLTFGVSASDPDPGDTLTLGASGLPANLTFVDNGDGTGAVSGTAEVAAGTYPVTFSVTDGVNPPVSAGLNIVVSKEDATLVYSGDSLVKKGLPVTLRASVSEAADGSPGDITKAAVFFDVAAAIGGGTTTYGPASVSATGEAIWSLPSGLPPNVYSVELRIDPANAYYTAPPADTAALVIYDPSAGFTTGGGWVPDAGGKGNFGFSVKYVGKGANIQGQALYVYRGDGMVRRVKSNSMQWLVINGNTAVFRGKATIDGLGGNNVFEITVVDNGEPGRNDTFAIKIWDAGGTLIHEVTSTALGGGNLIVPQPKRR